MTDSVSVVIGTFGDLEWLDRAATAALSALEQNPAPVEVIQVHGRTLAAARNAGACAASGDWLVFLDADDTLAPGYVAGVLAGSGDLRQPLVSFSGAPPVLLPGGDLRTGNFLVIGTAVRRSVFEATDGFLEELVFEDWSLWLRCQRDAGASIGTAPGAVYRATERPNSRSAHPEKWRVARELMAEHP